LPARFTAIVAAQPGVAFAAGRTAGDREPKLQTRIFADGANRSAGPAGLRRVSTDGLPLAPRRLEQPYRELSVATKR